MQYIEIPLERELFRYFTVPGRLNGLKAATWTITNSKYKRRCDKEVELFLSNRGTLIVYGPDIQIRNLIVYLGYVSACVI